MGAVTFGLGLKVQHICAENIAFVPTQMLCVVLRTVQNV